MKFSNDVCFTYPSDFVELLFVVLIEDVVWFPMSFVLIDGTPKHVPITTVQPTTPLIKGIITLFPNPDFGLPDFS